MFCPKCGNELPEGVKFCAACGTQIIKEATEESTAAQQGSAEKRSTVKKPILLGVIALVAILAIVLIIKAINKPSDLQETGKTETTAPKNTKSGFDSYEDAIDALFTAAYNNDVEAVVNCFPKEMDFYVKKLYNSYRTACESGGWSGELLNYGTGMFFAFEELNMDNEYYYEIEEVTEVEQAIEQGIVNDPSRDISIFTNDELQAEYGLTYDEAYIVTVSSMRKYNTELLDGGYVTDGTRAWFEVAEIGNKWYVLRVDDICYSGWSE